MKSEANQPPPEGWQHGECGNAAALVRSWRFADFDQTMAFVNAVAALANRLDHHPELVVGYDRCTVRWTTHDAGGVTARDHSAAAQTDALPAARAARAGTRAD